MSQLENPAHRSRFIPEIVEPFLSEADGSRGLGADSRSSSKALEGRFVGKVCRQGSREDPEGSGLEQDRKKVP